MVDINAADTGLVKFDGVSFKRKVSEYKILSLGINGEAFIFDDTTLAIELAKRKDLDNYRADYNDRTYLVPADMLTLTKESKNYKVIVHLENFSFGTVGKGIKPLYVSGVYLIKKLK
ncbi:hypothetical protein [Mucilaginibacter antarcticus]